MLATLKMPRDQYIPPSGPITTALALWCESALETPCSMRIFTSAWSSPSVSLRNQISGGAATSMPPPQNSNPVMLFSLSAKITHLSATPSPLSSGRQMMRSVRGCVGFQCG